MIAHESLWVSAKHQKEKAAPTLSAQFLHGLAARSGFARELVLFSMEQNPKLASAPQSVFPTPVVTQRVRASTVGVCVPDSRLMLYHCSPHISSDILIQQLNGWCLLRLPSVHLGVLRDSEVVSC